LNEKDNGNTHLLENDELRPILGENSGVDVDAAVRNKKEMVVDG
jgi:hypothetical protein